MSGVVLSSVQDISIRPIVTNPPRDHLKFDLLGKNVPLSDNAKRKAGSVF